MKPVKPQKGVKKNPFSSLDRIVQVNMLTYVDLDTSSAKVDFTIAHINNIDEPVEEFGMTRKLYYEINNDTKVDKDGNHLTIGIDPVDPIPDAQEDQGEFDYWLGNVKKVGLEVSLVELIEKLDDVNYFD